MKKWVQEFLRLFDENKVKKKIIYLKWKFLYISFFLFINVKNDKFVAATSLLDQSLLNKSINFKV